MKDVLVTGGAGFIGRNLLRQMVAKDYRVTVLDNYKIGGKEYIPDDVRDTVTWAEGDARQGDLVDELVKGKDGIIHLAAGSSFLMYEEEPIDQTIGTIHGFLNILESMRRHGVKKIAYASTSAVYEGNEVPYVEGMTIEPPDLKALSKKVNEEMAHQYSTRYGIQAVGLRPFSVYGHDEFSKGGYANVISLFIWAILDGKQPVVWGDGEQTRDFIYVDDVAQAFLLALEQDLDTQEFNVGTGIETSFNQVLDTVQEILGTDYEKVHVDVPIKIYAYRLLADTSLAESTLNFHPGISVRDGIERVVESAKKMRAERTDLGTFQDYYETLPKR